MKKILCLALALLMLVMVLVACGGKGGAGGGETQPGGTDGGSDTIPEVPSETNENGDIKQEAGFKVEDLDFEGAKIGIACRPETRYIREFGVESQSDPVDLKIYQRNSKIETDLGVKINLIECMDMWKTADIISYVKTESNAGVESDTDIVAAYGAYSTTPDLRGYYVNLLDKGSVPFLDTTKLYWNQSYVKAATCYDQLYYIVGDVNLTVYDKSIATFTNMDLAAQNQINPDDLYAAVENGEWTYDYFYEIVDNFSYLDTNEDKLVNVGDIVPLASVGGSEAKDPFLRAWDINLVLTNEDNSHVLNVDGNAKLEQAAGKLQQLYQLEGVYLDSIENTFDRSFVKGTVLFDFDIIYRNATSNNSLRNSGINYAILPLPKYDADQAEYLTTPQDAYNTMSVLKHHPDKLEAVSATLELLSERSYKDVRPFYIEKMVKATYVSGAKQVKMLELAMNGSQFDTATIYTGQLNSIATAMWRDVVTKGVTVSERWAERRGGTETAIVDFDTWFQASMG